MTVCEGPQSPDEEVLPDSVLADLLDRAHRARAAQEAAARDAAEARSRAEEGQREYNQTFQAAAEVLAVPEGPWVVERKSRRNGWERRDVWTAACRWRFATAGKAIQYWKYASTVDDPNLDLHKGERFRIRNVDTDDLVCGEIL